MRRHCVGEVRRLNPGGQKAICICQNSSRLHRNPERTLHLTPIFLVLTSTKFCGPEYLCCPYLLLINQGL
jgi:hypothetical protein